MTDPTDALADAARKAIGPPRYILKSGYGYSWYELIDVPGINPLRDALAVYDAAKPVREAERAYLEAVYALDRHYHDAEITPETVEAWRQERDRIYTWRESSLTSLLAAREKAGTSALKGDRPTSGSEKAKEAQP